MEVSGLTASDYAAWWGAIIASLALLWNIITVIRSGPRLSISANPNMQLFPETERTQGKTYIRLTATNVGTSPVTITNYCGRYCNSFQEVIQKKMQHFVVNVMPDLSSPIPHVLQPGTQWSGMLDQDGFSEDRDPPKYLYVGVAHSHSKKVKYVRVRIHA